MISVKRALAVASILFCISAGQVSAGDPVLPLAEEFASRLGWTPREAVEVLGAPANIFPYRGESESDDNVVFFYPDHSYIFWFRDRVWQARVDSLWEGSIDGVSMGMTIEDVISTWNRNPINMNDPAPTWTLPDRGYPVRIRLFFDSSGKLFDIYIFRSDW